MWMVSGQGHLQSFSLCLEIFPGLWSLYFLCVCLFEIVRGNMNRCLLLQIAVNRKAVTPVHTHAPGKFDVLSHDEQHVDHNITV